MLLLAGGSLSAEAQEPLAAGLETIRALRLAGELEAARARIELGLGREGLGLRDEMALRLELARIHDRVGLHTNSRPVAAALLEIERAATLATELDDRARGAVEAARATYLYRAEMAERQFDGATTHARRAIDLLRRAGDIRALSDAVHQLGLIHLQRREFVQARELFDESLTLDRKAGGRVWMLGEYHRHVAFIHALSDQWGEALPHFEMSLDARKRAGAIDASLFAAISLANALVRTGRPESAEPNLEYALGIARDIGSGVGAARASFALGEAYERTNRLDRAETAYRAASEAADEVALAGLASRAREALDRLARAPS